MDSVLTVEGWNHPGTIDVRRPRIAWRDGEAGSMELFAHGSRVWSSGQLPALISQLDLPVELHPHTDYTVKRQSDSGRDSMSFRTGFRGDWKGLWLTTSYVPRSEDTPLPVIRFSRSLHLGAVSDPHYLYLAARGIASVRINGRRASQGNLLPGWTDTTKRRVYVAHEVSEFLQLGENRIEVDLSEGWASGRLGWNPSGRNVMIWDKQPSFRLQLRSKDGCILETDPEWNATTTSVVSAGIYDGETVEGAGTPKPLDLQVLEDDGIPCEVLSCAPIQTHFVHSPISDEVVDGVRRIDFGQNASGVLQIEGLARTEQLTIRHGESWNPDGSLHVENLRSAKAQLVLSGVEGDYTPEHTFMGFRCIEVEPVTDASIQMQVWSSAACDGLQFSCSHPGLEQLVENTRWGLRSNLLSVPTDCPQRDERLGWTGDVLAIAPTACLYGDAWRVLDKWLVDLVDAQYEDGNVPDVAPDALRNVKKRAFAGHDAWGDASVFVPWDLYWHTGDERILSRCWPMMLKWLTWRQQHFAKISTETHHYGDWLAPGVDLGDSLTPQLFLRHAFSIRSADLVAQSAEVLQQANPFPLQAEVWREAFRSEWMDKAGYLLPEVSTQTACALAICFDLVPDHTTAIAEQLVEQVEKANRHLATGFVGTPCLLPALSRIGRSDLAWAILLQETYPGWLYSVKHGATTSWERWDSYDKEKGFHDSGMNSLNHYAYGCVVAWIIHHGLGLRATKPGWAAYELQPEKHPSIHMLSARIDTPAGLVSSSW